VITDALICPALLSLFLFFSTLSASSNCSSGRSAVFFPLIFFVAKRKPPSESESSGITSLSAVSAFFPLFPLILSLFEIDNLNFE